MAAKSKSKKQSYGGRSKQAPSSVRANKKAAKKQDTAPSKPKKLNKNLKIPISRYKYLKLTLQTTRRGNRKKTKKTASRLVAAVIIIISLAGTAYYSYKIFNAYNVSAPAPVAAQEIIPAVPPADNRKYLPESDATRIIAPSIDLDAKVMMVGRQNDGTLEVPKSYELAGQYKFSPTPGEIGPSVIVGHVDSIRGPAVFARIYQLKTGELIKVKRKDGSVATFKVTKVQNYNQNNFPAGEVYGNTENAQLRLITCGGTYNLLNQRYSDNTVVYASLF